jgi:hypothetical protein
MRALAAVASAKAGVRVQKPLQSYLGCRSKSKNCDEFMYFIVRVSTIILLFNLADEFFKSWNILMNCLPDYRYIDP